MKTVTFFSYKGDLGKSEALVNVANALSELGKQVCVLDFDLEAPSMHLAFRAKLNLNRVRSGLVDYITAFTRDHVVPQNILDFTSIIAPINKDFGKISLIGTGDTSSSEYWKNLAQINWTQLFYEKNSIGIDFFYNLKRQIENQLNPDILLIDSKSGISDIAGITMLIMADEVVLFTRNDLENMDGIPQVLRTLADPTNSIGQRSPKINLVVTRLPDSSDSQKNPILFEEEKTVVQSLKDMTVKTGKNIRIENMYGFQNKPDIRVEEEPEVYYKHDGSFDQPLKLLATDYLALAADLAKSSLV